MLGLRRREGISIQKFSKKFNDDFMDLFKDVIFEIENDWSMNNNNHQDLFLIKNDIVCLSNEGLLVYDEICSRLVRSSIIRY